MINRGFYPRAQQLPMLPVPVSRLCYFLKEVSNESVPAHGVRALRSARVVLAGRERGIGPHQPRARGGNACATGARVPRSAAVSRVRRQVLYVNVLLHRPSNGAFRSHEGL
jgi:hypothetical protein